jgi:hypothetical protein
MLKSWTIRIKSAKESALLTPIIRGRIMKTVIRFGILFFYIVTFFNFSARGEKSYGELHSIDFPKVITVPKDFGKDMNVSYQIYYIYHGKSIVSDQKDGWSFDYLLNYSPIGKISYLDKDGKPLPGAIKFFTKNGIDWMLPIAKVGGGDNFVEPFLLNGERRVIEIKLFSPGIFENTDIDEAIEDKSLSKIRIFIDKVEVQWKYIVNVRNGKDHIQEGEFIINVNKLIEIEVKYEDEKCEK